MYFLLGGIICSLFLFQLSLKLPSHLISQDINTVFNNYLSCYWNVISIEPIPRKLFWRFSTPVCLYMAVPLLAHKGLLWITGIDGMLAQRRGRDKCFCLCHESAFARGSTGKYGPPCIVAVIFKSVSRKALSREVVPFFGTLCCAQSVVGDRKSVV